MTEEVLVLTPADLQMVRLEHQKRPARRGSLLARKGFRNSLDDRLNKLPAFFSPTNNLFIEWSYVIDLDLDVFSVDMGAHFWLQKIPGAWETALVLDGAGGRTVDLSAVPADCVASLTVALPTPTITVPRNAQAKAYIIQAKGLEGFPIGTQQLAQLPLSFWTALQSCLRGSMENILYNLAPQDLLFRETAYAIIAIANSLSGNLMFVDSRYTR